MPNWNEFNMVFYGFVVTAIILFFMITEHYMSACDASDRFEDDATNPGVNQELLIQRHLNVFLFDPWVFNRAKRFMKKNKLHQLLKRFELLIKNEKNKDEWAAEQAPTISHRKN
jgi:hypothetical protein